MGALYYRWKGKKLITLVASTLYAAFFSPANAEDQITAGKVMAEMHGGERYSYVAGIIEGLAIARYAQDAKKSEGMNCIYHWFLDDKTTIDRIYIAFDHFKEYPPGSVVDALARKQCPR